MSPFISAEESSPIQTDPAKHMNVLKENLQHEYIKTRGS